MNDKKRIFNDNAHASRGSMLVELLMSVALAALIIPFVFQYQQRAVMRAENIAVTRQMDAIRTALERYMIANRDALLMTVGKNITRVDVADLAEYGLPETVLNSADDYQLRVLKSNDSGGQATLQGVIVLSGQDITPLRTREIVSLGGGGMGFVDGNYAYGTFGAWHANTVDLGLTPTNGIIETTSVSRDNALYLWRVPSTNASDATMMTALNLGGHNIENAKYFDASTADFIENLHSGVTVSGNVIFQNITTIDRGFETKTATVSGAMSADSRNMEIGGTFTLTDLGKFSNFTTNDLWVSNLTLGGLSISSDYDGAAVLKINNSLDMTEGRITAMFATVSFAGSITPRLVIKNRIEDSINPEYFWDASNRAAYLSDVILPPLNIMASLAARRENGRGTQSGDLFGAVAANKNATVADFMNAIAEIQRRVRAKYSLLNLE